MIKNKLFSISVFLSVFLFGVLQIHAQVKVGENPISINANSVLELESTNKGMLMPRIALTSTTVTTPMSAHVAGMTVYNTASVGDVTPGYYYNDGSKWVRLLNSASEPWFDTVTNAGATANTQNIYQIGNVGIFNTAPTEALQLGGGTNLGNLLFKAGSTNPDDAGDIVFANNAGGILGRIWSNPLDEGLSFGGSTKGGSDLLIGNPEMVLIDQKLGIGIGLATPSTKLDILSSGVGTGFRLRDGSQGVSKVLTSDANGVGSWQPIAITNVLGSISLGTGATVSYNESNFLQTGSSITLPPGQYAVNVSMLMTAGATSPNNSFFWLRTTFSDSNGANPTTSPDVVGPSNLISGNFPGSSIYAILSGTVVINNTSGANKTYYYVAGQCDSINTSQSLQNFGSASWGENNILAYKLN